MLYLAVRVTINMLDLGKALQVSINAVFFMQLWHLVAIMIFGVSFLFMPAVSDSTVYSLQLTNVQL